MKARERERGTWSLQELACLKWRILLPKSGEIAPERMKKLSQCENNAQL